MAKNMRAGTLDRILTIERKSTTTDAFGGEVETWAPIAGLEDIPASVEEIPDGEVWRAAEVQATVTTRFVIRWSPAAAGVTPLDRVKYAGKTFDINRTKELQRRKGVELTAAARAE